MVNVELGIGLAWADPALPMLLCEVASLRSTRATPDKQAPRLGSGQAPRLGSGQAAGGTRRVGGGRQPKRALGEVGRQ